MGTIFKRKTTDGQISYTARVRKKGFPHLVATFSRRTDAEAWVQQEEIKIRQGIHLDVPEARKHTLNDAIDRFVKEESPTAMRRLHLQRWKEKLGSFFLTAVTDIAINDAISRWKAEWKLTGGTLNRHLDSLSVVLKSAKSWGWIRRNPVRDAVRQPEPKGIVRYLSDDERKRLLKACKESEYKPLYTIVVLALSTGMRKEELLGLKWSNVDAVTGTIILTKTKNGERRNVAVRGHALELLKQYAKVRRIDSEFLFPGENPTPIKPCQGCAPGDRHYDIRAPWEAALVAADLQTLYDKNRKRTRDGFRFHDLRHSCASYLAMNGASALEIAEVLGHKSLDVVKRYAHLSESHTAGILEQMNRRFIQGV